MSPSYQAATRPPDVLARVTLLRTEEGGRTSPAHTGYRPQHRIKPDYLTSGSHEYVGTKTLAPGETADTYITFLTPEAYPRTLHTGLVLEVAEGSRIVGYAEVLDVYNELLRDGQPEEP